jgi:hypothetical protein
MRCCSPDRSSFERENRIILIVEKFSGPPALQAAAEYLEAQVLEVSVSYTSNVEFYLFDLPEWPDYVTNVRAFRFTDDAVFIRCYFPTFGWLHRHNLLSRRSTSLIQHVRGFLDFTRDGRHRTYWDVVGRNLIPH